jgi:hypothetical protein
VTGRKLLALAAVGALASACTDSSAPALTIGFRQPAAIVAFHGVTIEDAAVRPYFAVANAARNDLTFLDAQDDTAVAAPVVLRALAVPVGDRPSLLVAARLGDDVTTPRPDLLVAVSAGDSVLQVVTTWNAGNAVDSEPPEGPEDKTPAVDLGDDVVALTAVPSDPGTARVAAALAGGKIALVTWRRGTDPAEPDAIELAGTPLVATLGFQPIALAAMPDDPATTGVQTEIFAATLDEIEAGVFGVAAISELLVPRALDARGPTRLVAALRLRERDPASSVTDPKDLAAFTAAPVQRVFAALDDSGCGIDRRIECGIVALDPTTGSLAPDFAGVMPYRAPIPVPGRPLALAVATPPAQPPSADFPQYAGAAMRLMGGALEQATTAVGLVASDDGSVYFLDLGRFKLATSGSALGGLAASASAPTYADGSRLWVQALDAPPGSTEFPATTSVTAESEGGAFLDVTPGYTRSENFTVRYQGALPSLATRSAQAGMIVAGQLWLALQVPQPAGPTQVVKVYHPALGIRAGGDGDIAQIVASAIPGCDASLTHLEARIDEILAPTAQFPGGALRLVPDPALHPDEAALQAACFAALEALLPGGSPRLTATIRARGLVLTGAGLGYAGRPALGEPFVVLQYVNEDTVAGCPLALADWDGLSAGPPACDATCRAACEQLVLARKARRFHHGFESCAADDADCPVVAGSPVGTPVPTAGPALAFRVALQPDPAASGTPPVVPARDQSLSIATSGGVGALSFKLAGSPFLATSALAFDRTALPLPNLAAKGYRFLVSYSSDLVLDVTPHVNPVEGTVVR